MEMTVQEMRELFKFKVAIVPAKFPPYGAPYFVNMYVEEFKRGAKRAGELSLREFAAGNDEAGRYHAKCAYNLARNAVATQEAGALRIPKRAKTG
jgi:hypothetical protein